MLPLSLYMALWHHDIHADSVLRGPLGMLPEDSEWPAAKVISTQVAAHGTTWWQSCSPQKDCMYLSVLTGSCEFPH